MLLQLGRRVDRLGFADLVDDAFLNVEEGELVEHFDEVVGELFEDLAVVAQALRGERLYDGMQRHQTSTAH